MSGAKHHVPPPETLAVILSAIRYWRDEKDQNPSNMQVWLVIYESVTFESLHSYIADLVGKRILARDRNRGLLIVGDKREN
jgi:hypothetical protein